MTEDSRKGVVLERLDSSDAAYFTITSITRTPKSIFTYLQQYHLLRSTIASAPLQARLEVPSHCHQSLLGSPLCLPLYPTAEIRRLSRTALPPCTCREVKKVMTLS